MKDIFKANNVHLKNQNYPRKTREVGIPFCSGFAPEAFMKNSPPVN